MGSCCFKVIVGSEVAVEVGDDVARLIVPTVPVVPVKAVVVPVSPVVAALIVVIGAVVANE